LANTPGNREIILAEFGLDPARMIVIPNGYDPEDFKAFTPRAPHPPMIFGYLGGLDKPVYPWREVIHVFDALNTAGVPVVLRVQGSYSDAVAQEVKKLSHNCVELHPPVRHPESIERLQQCDAALLIQADLGFTSAMVPLKLYQYLGSGLPILAVGPKNGCATHIVRDSGGGRVVSPDDWDRVEQVIKDMYRDWQEHKLMGVRPDAARQFSYTTLMRKVTESLDHVYNTSQKSRCTA
jgi:glycosyltransferase involved in cell wall biosynthesis